MNKVDENDHEVHNHHTHDYSVFFNQTFSDKDTRVTNFSQGDHHVKTVQKCFAIWHVTLNCRKRLSVSIRLLPNITLQQVSRQDETQGTNDDSPAVETIEEKDENKTNIQENSSVARTSKAQYCGMYLTASPSAIGDH